MKTLKQFILERDMVGWYAIPKPVKNDLQKLGFNQKSDVEYVIEDDIASLFIKILVKGKPSREVEQYASKNDVTLDKNYPTNGYTLIIKW